MERSSVTPPRGFPYGSLQVLGSSLCLPWRRSWVRIPSAASHSQAVLAGSAQVRGGGIKALATVWCLYCPLNSADKTRYGGRDLPPHRAVGGLGRRDHPSGDLSGL